MSIINLKSQTDFSGFYIVFDYDEGVGERGLGHLVEHLVCKNFEDLWSEYDSKKVRWNAYTSTSKIVFYMTGLDRYISYYKDDFLERVIGGLKADKDAFNKERKIVIEEYLDNFASPESAHYYNLGRFLFSDYGAIGSKADIDNFKYSNAVDFYEKYMGYPVRIINVSKNSPFGDGMGDLFGGAVQLRNPTNYKPVDFVYDKAAPFEKSPEFIKDDIICLSPPVDSGDMRLLRFLATMYSSGLTSPLMAILREEHNLCYSLSVNVMPVKETGFACFSLSTASANTPKVFELFHEITHSPQKHLTVKRFEDVMEMRQIQLEMHEIERYLNIRKYIDPVFSDDDLSGITLDEIMRVNEKYFCKSQWVRSVNLKIDKI